MKSILLISFIVTYSLSSISQTANSNYDSTLAKKLNADEYGMKKYVFVILKTGKNKTSNKKFIDSCFAGHLKNIGRLAEQKKLIVAGPFGKNESNFRGLFILNIQKTEEANKILESDPAIKANLLSVEIYPWYGSAAISEYLEIHDKIWKKNP